MNSSIPSLLESVGLTQGPDGIWCAAEQEDLSYLSEGNDQRFEIEDKSFWFQHRNAYIVELVKNFPPCGKGPISGPDIRFPQCRLWCCERGDRDSVIYPSDVFVVGLLIGTSDMAFWSRAAIARDVYASILNQ